MSAPVTAETLTDEQIRELRRTSRYVTPRTMAAYDEYTDAQIALGELVVDFRTRAEARARCAAAYNAKHADACHHLADSDEPASNLETERCRQCGRYFVDDDEHADAARRG